ncbi:M23 family metallopeptidase [Kribbella sandramycini]|uniref:M23 family metallopeptidase n=1 Tax=Kribbella sandramycini TaxID=60450 RepID=A0A7Y4L166_9ACTN|nr:murein DD-endopeptidase MepM/ murein hydrolase activator NlpD [Kribbella sandramycini]NOL42433.1 M23 family metallopeptidase [Kribbella sandramycini]
MAKHRSTQRSRTRRTRLIGLTAALAATAGTTAVGLAAAPGQADTTSTGLSPSQAGALTAARIDRRDLGSRDATRFDLSLAGVQKVQAERQRAAALAKQAANATLTQRRAVALAAAKQQAARQAAAKAKALAKAKAIAIAKAKAAPRVVLPTTGYHLTARFGQAGGRWSRNHTGLDFAGAYGTPIRAVMAGEVIQAAFEGAYGRQVKVRHSDGTVTSYSHMAEFDVSVGEQVTAGTKVGAIGLTGNTTGAHVHFEVLPDGENPINPSSWLRAHGLNP